VHEVNEQSWWLGEFQTSSVMVNITFYIIMLVHFQVENLPRDDDLVGLLHEIHSSNIVGHGFRGYSVLGSSMPVREVAVSCFTLLNRRMHCAASIVRSGCVVAMLCDALSYLTTTYLPCI
jgi:hypothetical protein